MATIKKAQKGKKISPTYKNLRMGVENEYSQISGEKRSGIKPTSKDSARYRGGFEQGLKGMKGGPNEGQVEKMGRWEGQNAGKSKPKQKTGGVTKKKMQAGGVAGKQTKAGMVDPKGAYTKVQMRTLKSMKKGGSVKKAQLGMLTGLFKNNPITKKADDLRGKIGSAALGMPGMKPIAKKGTKMSKKK